MGRNRGCALRAARARACVAVLAAHTVACSEVAPTAQQDDPEAPSIPDPSPRANDGDTYTAGAGHPAFWVLGAVAVLAWLACCLCWRFKGRRGVRATPQPAAWPKDMPSSFAPWWQAQPESAQPALEAAGPSLASMHSVSLDIAKGITPAPPSQPLSEATTEPPQSSSGTRPTPSTQSIRALGVSAVGRVWRGRIRKPGAIDVPRRRALRSATDVDSSDTGGISGWPSVLPASSTNAFEAMVSQGVPPTARFGPRHIYIAATAYTTLVPESSALVPDSDLSYVPSSECAAPPDSHGPGVGHSIFVTAQDSSALVPESDATHAPNSETLDTSAPFPTARSSVDTARGWRQVAPPARWRLPSPRGAYTSAPGSLTSYGSDLASQSTNTGSLADRGPTELALLPARSATLRSHYRAAAAVATAGPVHAAAALRGPNSNLVGGQAGVRLRAAVARLHVAPQHSRLSDSSLMSLHEQPESTLHDNSLTLRLPYIPTSQAGGSTIYHNSTYVPDRALREDSEEAAEEAAERKAAARRAGPSGGGEALWKRGGDAQAEAHAQPRSVLCSTGLVSLSTLAEGSSCAHLLSSQNPGDFQGYRESEGSDGVGPGPQQPRVSDGSARSAPYAIAGPHSMMHSQTPAHHGVSRERSAAATFGHTLPTHLEA